MSVLMEFAIFPTDKGKSVSKDVSDVIQLIRKSGYPYQLTAMGTLIETPSVADALKIVEDAAMLLQINSERIYATLKLDIKPGCTHMLEQKVKSIQDKIGE
jgi:uncharacterized protein (TIGR00106 family)